MKMNKKYLKIFLMFAGTAWLAAGCATTRASYPESKPDAAANAAQYQSALAAKEQEIQELRSRLESRSQITGTTPDHAASDRSQKFSIIKVEGVTVKDLQKALMRAGFNPGQADGHMRKKTKKAVKAFQRKNKLPADGIVGEKTWAFLKA